MNENQVKGGKTRAKKLSAEQRREIASKAAQSRWQKSVTNESNSPKALYTGVLPIGDVEIDCAVLDDGRRVLTATSIFNAFDRTRKGMNSRLEIDGKRIPPFLAAKNLEKYITPEVVEKAIPITYVDGNVDKTGYLANILPKMCEVYLNARRDNQLADSQKKLAEKSEILLMAFAQVGIDALIDEATGYQYDRKHDALRILLAKYIEEGLQKWIKTFPDAFFAELDRLYNNGITISRKRPMYYGNFINKYVYEPIEHGYIKEELNKKNIKKDGKRIAQFHRWLTEEGRNILILQIGRVSALMEISKNIEAFKRKVEKQKEISIAPYLFEEMNEIE